MPWPHTCDVLTRNPPRLPIPVRMFERMGFVGKDLCTMWRWLRTAPLEVDPGPTRALLPEALTVRDWLARRAGLVPAVRGSPEFG